MQTRMIAIEEAFNIIQRVHQDMGWKPNGSTNRDQRNAWWEAAVAVVHFGHPLFNPLGGDRSWMIKRASRSSPQSDDVIVHATTRAYYDFILNTGADNYQWNLGRHDEPLPTGQVVYPPEKDSLGVLPGPTDPGVVKPGDPQPDPEGPTGELARDVADLKAQMASVVEAQAQILSGIGTLTAALHDLSTQQHTLFDNQTKRMFGLLVEPDGSVQPGLPQVTADLVK